MWSDLCKILRTLRSDMCKADTCFRAERLGDWSIEALTAATFSGPIAVLGQPGLFLFKANDVCLKLETHLRIVFLSGTES